MKYYFAIIAFFSLIFNLRAQDKPEVLYRIDTPHFFDSDGDGQGDLKGILLKMDHLERLGITSILLSPVYDMDEQGYSNNEFILENPKQGLLGDYRNVVAEAHKKAIKVYQELNLAYVGAGHSWFKHSYKKPASEYGRFLYYSDDKNDKPVYLKEKSIAVNLLEPKVQEYMLKMLKQWADPNKDKVFNDGVDGFVLDMADKTPGAPKLINLYDNFWKPLTDGIKTYNPKVKIMAQQDVESLVKAGAERVFSGKLEKGIASRNKKTISAVADTVFKQLPAGKQVLVAVPDSDAIEMQKTTAALAMFMGGIPVLQSGREIAAKDATMDWKAAEEQAKDPNSILNFYKQLVKAYKTDPGLSQGTYKEIVNSSNEVVSFTRTYKNFTALVLINLSGTEQSVVIGESELRLNAAKVIFGDTSIVFPLGSRAVTLPPYGIQAWRIVTGLSK